MKDNMLTIEKSIPCKEPNNILYERKEQNDGKIMISRKHPELQQLLYNKTTLCIFDLCTGANTIEDIVNAMSKKYVNTRYNELLDDTINTLHMLWRLGFVRWTGKNPFTDIYSAREGDLTFLMLDEDQTVDWMKNNNPQFITPINIVESNYSETAIKQNCFSFYETYFQLRKGDEEILTMSLIVPIGRECFFKIGILNTNMSNQDSPVYHSFLKWTANKHKQFFSLSSRARSILCYVRSDDEVIQNCLERNLSMSCVGVLEKELKDGSDVALFQLRI